MFSARFGLPRQVSGVPSAVPGPAKIPIDSNGNLTQKVDGSDTWAYEWNALNQLTRVTKNSVEQARFSYDPLGRRVEKVAGGVTTTYTYDEDDILREVRGATVVKYVHSLGVDEPLAREDGGGTLTYYQADGLGSVMKVTDSSGAVVNSLRYDVWGNVEAGTPSPFGFTAREHDETGLIYFRARYLDSRVGRFASEDPVHVSRRKRFEIDGYSYVGGRVTRLVDPYGRQAEALLCILNPFDCAKVNRCAEQAFMGTVMRFGNQGHNDASDAFRHCFLSCCMAQRIGARKAQQFGDAHEAFPGNPNCENKMDQANNATGRALGTSSPTGNCYVMCSNTPLQNCPVSNDCGPTGGGYTSYAP